MKHFLSLLFFLLLSPSVIKSDTFAPSDIQVSKIDAFLASETPSLNLYEGMPTVAIYNHVHAITGAFFDHQTDLELGFGFNLDRTYISEDDMRGSLVHGWNHNHEDVLHTENRKSHRYAITKGKSGGECLYKGYLGESGLKTDAKNFKKGMTNCNGCELSARTNAINNSISKGRGEKYILKTAFGDQLDFEKVFKEKHYYQAVHKQTSFGHHLDYSYDPGAKRVKQVTYRNSTQKELAKLNFNHPSPLQLKQYSKKSKKSGTIPPYIEVSSSDGRSVRYKIGAFIYGGDEEVVDKRRYRITHITRPNAPDEEYEYKKMGCCELERLVKKTRPDGRYLEIDYYDKGKNFALHKVKTLKAPNGGDPTPALLYQFFYEKNSSHEAQTVVQDGLGHRTIYYYNSKNHLLNTVERLYGNSNYSLHSLEKLRWGNESLGTPLLAREIYNHDRQLVLKRSYEYDKKGNVLKSTLTGNLTGKAVEETFAKTFTYTNDEISLLQSITEGEVHTEYRYLTNSDLVAAEYTKAGPYQIRVFTEYDENLAICSIIRDDGAARECHDLSGVTERTIQRMSNTLAGLPEVMESLYVDMETKEEKLLSRVVRKYDKWCRCIEEATYDNQGIYAYSWTWEYNDYGLKTLEINPLGVATHYDYDLNGNLLSEYRPSDNRRKNYTYDLRNQLIKTEIRDFHTVHVESFQYDVMGNMTSHTDTNGSTTRYHYDSQGQLCTISYPPDENNESRREFREYDSLGNCFLTVDGNGHRTVTLHNVRGAPYQIEHPDGTIERYEYALSGERIKYIAPNGLTVCTEYDALSRPVCIRTYDAIGELLDTTTKQYNALHLISEVNAEGVTTYYRYDGAGRLIETVKGCSKETIEYDSLGRKSVVGMGTGLDTIYLLTKYDVLNRIIGEETRDVNGSLQLSKSYEYDYDGNRTHFFADKSLYLREYNALGQLTKEIDPLNQITRLFYQISSTGHSIASVDSEGYKHIQFYNQLNELIQEQWLNLFGETTKKTAYRYDKAGNRIAQIHTVISPENPDREIEVRWGYDCMNRLIYTQEAARCIKRTYDSMGNLSKLEKADGVVLYYVYDAQGRVERYFSSDETIDYSFEYTLNHLPVKITDNVHGIISERSYNENNCLTLEKLANGLSVSYEHDSLGRTVRLIYPDQSQVQWCYNGVQLKQVIRTNHKASYTHTYTQYDLNGNVIESDLIQNLGALHFSYDACNRISAIHTPYMEETSIQYDFRNNLISRQKSEQTLFYTYDDLNQLQSESGEVENSYLNDSMQNQVRINGKLRTFNDYHELENGYEYDLNGNVIRKGNQSFQYDALNRLIKVTGDEEYEYCYDAYHRRIAKRSNGYEDRYFYQGLIEIGVVNKENVTTEARVLGKQIHADIGATIIIELKEKSYATLHDSQGNITLLINADTRVIAEANIYSAYGQEFTQGTKLSPWRCASKRLDQETGFINFGRRFYDPDELRWISLDPILRSEGLNRYNYLENNPLRYVDPDGRFAFAVPIVMCVWGGTVTAATITTTQMVVAGCVVGATAALCTAQYNGYSLRTAGSADIALLGGSVISTETATQRWRWDALNRPITARPPVPVEIPQDDDVGPSSKQPKNPNDKDKKPPKPWVALLKKIKDFFEDKDWEDVSHPEQRKRGHFEMENIKTGERIRIDKGRPGTTGFESKDHYHIYNPDKSDTKNIYLDKYGNPCSKNSRESHILFEDIHGEI